MRILVTGGSGFIGTNLIQELLTLGHSIVNLDIVKPRNPSQLKYWQYCNILDRVLLASSIADFNPNVLFHLAARTDLNGRSIDDYPENIVGVENLICSVEGLNDLHTIIFASSRLVCEIGYQPISDYDYCPSTFYGESKVIGEQLVRSSFDHLKPCVCIVRPTSIWGPWFSHPYKDFFLTIANNRYFHPGDLTILKSFGFVGNTVFQLIKLMQAPSNLVDKNTFYLADYPPIDLTAMANEIQVALKARRIKSINIYILKLVAKFGDLLKFIGWPNPPLTSFRLNNLVTPMVYDLDPLSQISGPLPYSLNQGIENTVRWLIDENEIN